MGSSLYLGDKHLGGTIIDDVSTNKNRTWSSEKIFDAINGEKAIGSEEGYLNSAGDFLQEPAAIKDIVNTVSTDYITIPTTAKKLTAYAMATIDGDATSLDKNTSNSMWLAVAFYDASKRFIIRMTPNQGSEISPYKYNDKSLVVSAEDIPTNAKYIRLSWRNWKDGECRFCFNEMVTVLAKWIDYTYKTDSTFANVFSYNGMEFGYLGGTNLVNKPGSDVEYTNRKAYTTKEFAVTGSYVNVNYTYYIQEVLNTNEWNTDPDKSTWAVWIALDKDKKPLNTRPYLASIFEGKKQSTLESMMDANGLFNGQISLTLPTGTKFVRFSWRTYGINPVDAKGTEKANAVYGLDMKVYSSQIALLSDIIK